MQNKGFLVEKNKLSTKPVMGVCYATFTYLFSHTPYGELEPFMGVYSANITQSCASSKIPKSILFQLICRTTVPTKLVRTAKRETPCGMYFS